MSIVDFFSEKIGVVFVVDLNGEGDTVAVPVCPHSPSRLNWLWRGMRRCLGMDLRVDRVFFHLMYSC